MSGAKTKNQADALITLRTNRYEFSEKPNRLELVFVGLEKPSDTFKSLSGLRHLFAK